MRELLERLRSHGMVIPTRERGWILVRLFRILPTQDYLLHVDFEDGSDSQLSVTADAIWQKVQDP